MRTGPESDVHLTYCTNIHPGESWPEVRRIVEEHVVAVKRRVSPNAPFGIGLRLSALAAEGLAAPGALDDLRALLGAHGLYVFTINGFPYGRFHATRVKENVYRPDWSEPARLSYTNLLADLLAELLPNDVEGSVSTAPLGFAPRMRDASLEECAARALLEHARHLHCLRERTGLTIGLAIEPEPACRIETTADAVDFFERRLLSRAAVERQAQALGSSLGEADESLRRHLGLCLDTCHAAVEFEDALESVARVERAGIRILKVQLTAGLRLARLTTEATDAVRAFADDVYLHQVVAHRGGTLARYLDLPDALDDTRSDAQGSEEWRIHFHVPLHLEALAPLGGTHSFVDQLLARHRQTPVSRHLEVETYTWDVLPEQYRREDVVTGIVRELRWALERVTA